MLVKTFTKSFAAILLLLISFNISFAHWSTRGPYGGHVTAFTAVDTITFLGSSNGGVYRATNTQFTNWIYRNYTGLGSGKITALTSIGRKVVAATADSGVYISNDLGLTWAPANSGLTNLQVLALTTSSNGKLYAGTNGGGVFLSLDSGTTWTAKSLGLTNQVITCFVSLGDTVVAGTRGGGINVSVTAGNFWLTLNNGLTDFNINALAFSLSGVGYVGTPSGVFQGNLSTFVWSIANNGLTNTNVNALYLNGTDLYAGTNAGVFNTPIANISWAPTGTFTDTINTLTVYGSNLLAGTRNQGVQKSTISAYTWAASHTGFNNLKSFAGAAKDSTVAVANEQGVFVCKNFVASAVYVKSNNGLADSLNVTALQFNAAHTLYAGTKNAGVFVTTDSGATWVSANTGLTSLYVVKLLATTARLYAATSDGKVFSTLQSNVSWTEVSTGLPANLIVTSIAGAGGDTILVGATTGVYGSIGGANWVTTGLTQFGNSCYL
jgi:ligand-binding sensor domain-containing protein